RVDEELDLLAQCPLGPPRLPLLSTIGNDTLRVAGPHQQAEDTRVAFLQIPQALNDPAVYQAEIDTAGRHLRQREAAHERMVNPGEELRGPGVVPTFARRPDDLMPLPPFL